MTTTCKYLVTILLEKITHYNTKRGVVCVYYKNTRPFKLINTKYLQESITFEIGIGRKCYKFICRYRSPSQTNDKFESFLKNFELTLEKIHEDNPFMISALGDFNTKSKNWCKNDITSHDGPMSDVVMRVIMDYIN